MQSLKDDEIKLLVVNLDEQGYSASEIAAQTGLGKSTITDFLRKESWQQWWATQSTQGEQQDGFKMVFLDLEVAPAVVMAFNMFKHFSSPDHIMQFPYVLTAAWNWLHDPEDLIHSRSLMDYEVFEQDVKDDSELIYDLWKVLDEADIVVAQNAKFDIGWFNQQCALYGIPEPSPYRIICTLKADKNNFSLPSNSLGYVVKYFRLEQEKLKHDGIDLWRRCMAGDADAFEDMLTYNRGDIPTLRNLYLTTRAHIEKHPNLAMYYKDGKTRCPVCGGEHLEELQGKLAFTNLSKFTSYRCLDCGTVKRGAKALNTTEQRKAQLRNVVK